MTEICHPIRVVARRTGLSPHVIRIWERRYRAVSPQRSGSQRRLYSEKEIERLVLLRGAINAGHSIGNIAHLEDDDLRRLALSGGRMATPALGETGGQSAGRLADGATIEDALQAIFDLNQRQLESLLHQLALELGAQGLLQQFISPLVEEMGRRWEDGILRIAHEHFASSCIKAFLRSHIRPYGSVENGPMLVVATPVGQIHELGAVMVSAAALNKGWRSTYIGANLPAAEIAAAAVQCQAMAVALSLVYPADDSHLPEELVQLRRFLPEPVTLLAGGRGLSGYQTALDELGAISCQNLKELSNQLDQLRS